MPDNLKPADRRQTMQAVKGKGTSLERKLASMLAGMRIKGWKKNIRELIGKPDIVFPKERIGIFIDGCFWHGCPVCQRRMPETNKEYWETKIKRNIERAKYQNQVLSNEGWVVIRIWEHEMRDPASMKIIKSKLRLELEKANVRKRSGCTPNPS